MRRGHIRTAGRLLISNINQFANTLFESYEKNYCILFVFIHTLYIELNNFEAVKCVNNEIIANLVGTEILSILS
jgi:hypothetical protein